MLIEILPFLPFAGGGVAVGAGLYAGAATLFSRHKKVSHQRIEEQQKQDVAEYAQLLLDKGDQVEINVTLYTADVKRPDATFKFSIKRGNGVVPEGLYETSKFNGLTRDELIAELHNSLKAHAWQIASRMTAEEMYYFLKDFNTQVFRRVLKEMTTYGFEVSEGSVSVSFPTGLSVNVEKMRKVKFSNLIGEIVPVFTPSWKNKGASVNPAQVNNSSTSTNTSASLEARLTYLEDSWLEYELNPTLLLDYPLMSDASCEETSKFLTAMSRVKALSARVKTDKTEESLQEDLAAAISEAETAFTKAENNAKKMRHAHLDTAQRKKVKDARALVAMLKDDNASPQEKVNAYRKAGDFLEGIIALPERPVMGLLSAS